MKSFTGNELDQSTRGLLYICNYNYVNNTIEVQMTAEFQTPFEALNAYANIPNPESQMASGSTKEEFEQDLQQLHARLSDPEWVKELADYL